MQELFYYSGEQKLSIEKQLKVLLISAETEKANGELKNCKQRLKHGLAICENTGSFTSPSSCRTEKSKFQNALGVLYH